MKRLLFFLLLISFRHGIGQTYVLIPDVNFRSYLQAIIPTAMSGNSLNISHTLVTTYTQTINVNGINISDLTGIQYFSSLKSLICSSNSLTSLPPLPSSLINLYCSYNLLLSLPPLPNSLQGLQCSWNALSSLPPLPNSLILLSCEFNPLYSLPVLPNSLIYLECWSDSLTNLPALPNSLTELYCEDNNITCFPVFPNSITNIAIFNNPFTCLPNYLLSAMPPNLLLYPLCAVGNPNGCGVAGIKQITSDNNLMQVYPNPTNGQFTIETIVSEKQTIQLFDLNGKLLFEQFINAKTNIDATNLNSGVYNLTIKTAANISTKKLVIVR